MKAKVSAMKGTPSVEQIEVPSSLKSIFPVKARLGVDEILAFGQSLDKASNEVQGFHILDQMSEATKLSDIINVVSSVSKGAKIEFGSEAKPMPGGTYMSWEFKLERETDDNVETVTLDVQEESGKAEEAHKNAQLDIANKEQLKRLIDTSLKYAKDLAKFRDKADKRMKAANNALKALDKEINSVTDKTGKDAAKSALRSFNLIMSKGPVIEAKLLSFQLTGIKGVLGYAAICIKNTRTV